MPAFYYSIGARYYKCERFTITMEVSCMKTQRRTADEQYQLILECRSSGLSDYQWCTEHNINPGTFYNWVKRLRKKACYDIPSATGRGNYKPALKQDVVKLEVIPDHQPPSHSNCRKHNASSGRNLSRHRGHARDCFNKNFK